MKFTKVLKPLLILSAAAGATGALAADPRVETVLLNVGDGLLMARKR